MEFKLGKVHTTIRMTVVTVFIIATILTAAVAIGLQYYFGQAMAKQTAQDLYTLASSSVAIELRSIGTVNANVLELLADNPTLPDPSKDEEHLRSFTRVLDKNPLYYGVYVGRSDGSFFEVVNLDASELARSKLRAFPTDRWLVINVTESDQGRERHYRYLDKNLEERFSRSESTDFNVIDRPWYFNAMGSDSLQRSDPYLFAQLGVPGRTISKRIEGADAVVAIDMTLSAISGFLQQHQLAQHAGIYLYDNKGQVIASSIKLAVAEKVMPIPALTLTPEERSYLDSLPPLRVSNELDWPPFDYTLRGTPRGYSIDVIKIIAEMTGLEVEFINGYNWQELIDQFKAGKLDLLHSVFLTRENQNWGLSGSAYTSLPYALATLAEHPAITDMSQLNGKSLAIPIGWSVIPVVEDNFPEIEIVQTGGPLEALEAVIHGEASAALDNEVIMRDIARLHFLQGLKFHSDIEFGTKDIPDKLHILVSEDKPELRAILDRAIAAIGPEQENYLSSTWLNLNRDEGKNTANTVPTDLLLKIAGDRTLQDQILETEVAGAPHLVYASAPTRTDQDSPNASSPLFVGILAPLDSVVGPFLDKVKLSIGITGGFLLLLLPLSWIFANPIVRPIRQLAAENDKVRLRQYDEVEKIDSRVKELDELSESMVNMVAAIQAHELAQRKLMDAFIQLIAQAIDDKSPYTAGHCARVPVLALMLAEHASNSDLPAFRDFRLDTDDQWREYRIAAWLHDCGKITTPEHIVDKGSKLEAIYNRVHEVRMRFEALWRDAEIEYWEALHENPGSREDLMLELQRKQQQLQDDYNFVAECNVGGEFLDEDKQSRLKSIAEGTWKRYFDDRIGLSPVEELRLQDIPVQQLPATEPLLSDKSQHIFERTRPTDYPPEFGINMDIPAHLYNQGEVYNLSISRGTLTAEDRFKINEHMISTIKMLESLPFPPELKNVPLWASTHHETMGGTGYPRKLPGEQLSIPERIMAVADVFEALTAADRPYKKAKPVSVAVDILHKMVLDQHIDPECFELFIRSKVYLQYANEYLSPNQVDEIDEAKYIGESA